MDADIAVVGYGPAGMASAALLARAGHRVLVLERYDGLYNLPRAAIFDDETMRTLDKLGIAEPLLPTLHVQRNYEWRNRAGDLLIEHSFAELGRSGWAEWYMMYQPQLEDALDGVCRSSPLVEIRLSCPTVDLTEDPTGVTVAYTDRTTGTDRPATARVRYVVGCDGGNSTTRRLLGIEQDDYGFSEPWMVCDFTLHRGVKVPMALQIGDPDGPTSIISLGPDHHRFSFMLDSEQDFALQSRPELVWARVAEYLSPDDAELIRVATYTFRSLVAHRWRCGRVLLAGDAAHQMPPFLGQGMCSGIRDAQNLAFKLDLVLRGHVPDDLLDTYQLEREPHVRAVIEKGIELGRLQTVRDHAVAVERDRQLLERRAAHEAPEKMHFPGLAEGMLASARTDGRGELFIQGEVGDGERRGRFDDIVGRGFVLLTDAAGHEQLTSQDLLAALDAAGVLVVGLADPADLADQVVTGLVDVSGSYTRWFAEHGCTAVAVRPDFYVYGCAANPSDTATLAAELLEAMGVPVTPSALASVAG